MKKIITFFLICFTTLAFAQNTTYITNRDCQVKWTGKKLTGESHTGTINLIKGQVLVENKTVKKDGIVYTSGVDGIIDTAIPIGKIFVEGDKRYVKFFVDFNQLKFVKINN